MLIIDENFLNSDRIINKIEQEILHTAFYYRPPINGIKDGIVSINGNFAEHTMFVGEKNITDVTDQVFEISKYILDVFSKKHSINIKNVYKAKANITLPSLDSRSNSPHIDTKTNHYVFLYYVNSSEGDTILYNQKSDGLTKFTEDDLSVYQTISPSAGKAVLFSGDRFHSWKAPQNSKIRCVINMNLELNK